MATHAIATIDHPEGNKLRQLHSVDYDLANVIELCDSITAQPAAAKWGILSGELHDVYTVAILIRFMRAVGNGIRHQARFTEEDRATLAPELLAAWKYFDDLRDKHIAHSVNGFEETSLGFSYIVGEEDKAVITAITTGSSRLVGLSGGQISEMKQLCLTLRAILGKKIKDEEARLLPILHSLPAKQWIDRGMRRAVIVDHSRVGKPRKQG